VAPPHAATTRSARGQARHVMRQRACNERAAASHTKIAVLDAQRVCRHAPGAV